MSKTQDTSAEQSVQVGSRVTKTKVRVEGIDMVFKRDGKSTSVLENINQIEEAL